jgi:hypothetical protein
VLTDRYYPIIMHTTGMLQLRLILVIYWKKTGLLRTKISNHNIIYSSRKPRKSSSLPLKSSSELFSLDASLVDVQVFISLEINIYPQRIGCSSNLGHIFRGEKMRLIGREIR